jgi:hypothetical protein
VEKAVPRVCLGLMCPGHVRVEMYVSHMNALALCDPDRVHLTGFLARTSGPYLDSGRNRLVQDFMADDELGDWLLFVDDDIEFSPSDLEELFAVADHEYAPVVSGVYVSALPEGRRVIAFRRDENMNHVPLRLDEVQGDGVVPIDSAGAGFLAMSRPFLKRMGDLYGPPDPWFCEPIMYQRHHGEDLGFFMRVRDMGVQPLLVCGVKLGHIKTVKYTALPMTDGASA